MNFNPSKCSLLRITKRRSSIKTIYNMMGTDLQQVDNHPYLGVEFSSKVDWGQHINKVTNKVRRSLNFLQRNLYKCPEDIKQQAYTAIVRPILEYSCTAWDPYYQKHISALESVQRKAARFVKENYQRKASVTQMLQELNWASLEDRRTVARLTMLYKINSDELPITIPKKFIPVTRNQRPSPEVKDQTSMSTFLPELQKYTRTAFSLGPSVNGINYQPT